VLICEAVHVKGCYLWLICTGILHVKIRDGRKSRKPRKNWHGGVKEPLKETHFFPFFWLLDILQIVKHGRRKSVAFQVLAMNLLRRNVVQNARQRARVQKCMGSVILHFSSIKKVRPQNVWKETHTCSIWWFSCTLKSAWLGREKFALLLVLERVPGTFDW